MENQDSTNSFQVNLDQFNGPLDLLLDLAKSQKVNLENVSITCLLYTSPSPRDLSTSRMPSSA